MKCLIVLALATLAHAYPYYYYPVETPALAQAKSNHVAEVARAYAAASGPYYPYARYSSYPLPVVTPEGVNADTPEVGAAKLAYYANKARTGYPYYYRSYPYYYPY